MEACFSVTKQCYTSYSEPVWWGCGVSSSTSSPTAETAFLESQYSTVLNVPHNDTGFSIARKGQALLLNGEVPPSPPTFLIGTKVKSPSFHFEKRRRDGEIVLNPYYISEIIATPQTKLIFTPTGACPHWVDRQQQLTLRDFNIPFSPPPCNYDHWFNGRSCYADLHYTRQHGTVSRTMSPWSLVSEQQLRSVFETYTNTLDDPSFIQGVIAELNARSVDFLTTIFELPETIISIGQILKGCKKIIQSFITKKSRAEVRAEARRQFYLQNSKKILDRIHEVEILLQDNAVPASRKRLLKKQKRRLQKEMRQNDRDYKNVATNLFSTVSSLWLQLRYEIMPNLYLCEDLADSAFKVSNVYQTERGTIRTEGWIPQFPGFECSGSVHTTFRFMAKYGYSADLSNLYDIRKAFSTNPFVTVWELGKLSFVLDWFFSVGDMLQAKFGKPSLAVQQGFFLSQKNSLDLTYTNASDGCIFTITGGSYKAYPVFPEEFLGIFPLINLNWKRLADSSALMWGELRRHFKLK